MVKYNVSTTKHHFTKGVLPDNASDIFRAINKELLAMQAKTEGIREVAADFDDSVITVLGNQERSNIGYNPKYHGRPSYKEKVGVISGTKELVDLTLEEGSHHSNYEFLDFFKLFESSLPKQWLLKRVRADRGFFYDPETGFYDPMLSPLYRLRKVRPEELSEEDKRLINLKRKVNGNEAFAKEIWNRWGCEPLSYESVLTVFEEAAKLCRIKQDRQN